MCVFFFSLLPTSLNPFIFPVFHSFSPFSFLSSPLPLFLPPFPLLLLSFSPFYPLCIFLFDPWPTLLSPPLSLWGPATSPILLWSQVWPFIWVSQLQLFSSFCFLWPCYTSPCAYSTRSTPVLASCCSKWTLWLYTACTVDLSKSLSLLPCP